MLMSKSLCRLYVDCQDIVRCRLLTPYYALFTLIDAAYFYAALISSRLMLATYYR